MDLHDLLIFFYFQVASSLNSSYCYILHSGDTVFTWFGSLSTSVDQELAERLLDLIKVCQTTVRKNSGSHVDPFILTYFVYCCMDLVHFPLFMIILIA